MTGWGIFGWCRGRLPGLLLPLGHTDKAIVSDQEGWYNIDAAGWLRDAGLAAVGIADLALAGRYVAKEGRLLEVGPSAVGLQERGIGASATTMNPAVNRSNKRLAVNELKRSAVTDRFGRGWQ